MTLNINLENKTIARIVLVVLALTLGVAAIGRMRTALTLVGIAIFIALALNPAVSWLARHLPGKGHRGIATGIAFLVILSSLGGLLWATIPPIAKESGDFIRTFPTTVRDFRYRNEKVSSFIDRNDLQPRIDKAIQTTKDKAESYADNVVSGVGSVTSSVLNTISVLVMAFLFLVEGPSLLTKLQLLIRTEHNKKRITGILAKMYKIVTGYVNGQLIVALVASLFAFGFMLLVRVPYPLPLSMIVFLFGLIPLVGNIMAAVLVAIAALVLKSAPSALLMLAFFIVYQQLENLTVQPLVQSKTTSLSPLIIFVSVILGVGLMGPIGGLVAIPLAGCTKILLIDYLEHRTDGEASPKGLIQKLKDRATVKKLAHSEAKKD